MLTPADLPPISAIPAALAAVLVEIMRREGTRFEDDPDDPGGATSCGISLAFARAARLDVDGDGDTDLDDIKAIHPDLAERLIFQKFYLDPGVALLPECVRPLVLDTAFNCGIGGSRAILIAALIECGRPLSPTPATLGGFADALRTAQSALGCTVLIDMMVRTRIVRYRRLVSVKQHLAKYLNGWFLRALHYGSADLRQRYAALLERYHETP